MVWVCFSGANGRGGLFFLPKVKTMCKEQYMEVLREKMTPRYHHPAITHFLQDGAPCHKAKVVMEMRAAEQVSLIDWPGNSPDLNPIKNAWSFMKEKFRKKSFKNMEELKTAITELLVTGMPLQYCKTLARSMSHRLQAVVNANGHATKY